MRLAQKIIYGIALGCCLQGAAFAQAFDARGIIFNQGSSERISQVQITDLKNHLAIVSGDLGSFQIKVSLSDTLLFTKAGYTPQKLVIVNTNDLIIYMQPVRKLHEVLIKGKTTGQDQKEIVDAYRSKGLYFDGRPPLIIFNPISGSPLTGFHELFGKDAVNERRFIRSSQNEQQAVEIDKKYTKELVKSITHLSGEELQAFMDTYRPFYNEFKNWNDYQLRQYIQTSFETWQNDTSKVIRSPFTGAQ